jgi:DNA-binding transcriptional ArsR family regulator
MNELDEVAGLDRRRDCAAPRVVAVAVPARVARVAVVRAPRRVSVRRVRTSLEVNMKTWWERFEALRPTPAEWIGALRSIVDSRRAELDEVERELANEPRNPSVPAIRPQSLPRPRRTVTDAEVLRLLDDEPRGRGELATQLGGDLKAVGSALRALVRRGVAVQSGAKSGTVYTRAPSDVPAGLEREECGT